MNIAQTTRQIARNEQFLANYFTKFQHLYRYSSEQFIRGMRVFSVACGLTAMCIGIIALVGWYSHLSLLQSIFPGLPLIRFDPALAFIFIGISLTITPLTHENVLVRFIIRFCKDLSALIVIMLSGLVFVRDINSENQLINQYVVKGDVLYVFLQNVMSPLSAFIFIIIAVALLVGNKKYHDHSLNQYLMLMAAIIISPTIIAYIYNMEFIFRLGQLPLPSTIAFLLLIVGVFIVFPEDGIMGIFTSESAGGFMARKLLFTTILTPLLLGGIIIIGFRIGLYSFDYSFLLLVISTVIVYTFSIWRNARDLHSVDLERRQSVQQLIFLAAVSRILSTSLDYKSLLNNVAQLIVGQLADICFIDIVQPDGHITTVAFAYKNTRQKQWKQKIRLLSQDKGSNNLGSSKVLRTGKAEIYSFMNDSSLKEEIMSNEDLRAVKKLNLQSAMIVPLFSHRKVFGTITFISTDANLHFTSGDLIIAEELAARASLAFENARLYRQAQNATKLRDEFISIASHELRTPVTSLKVYTQVIAQHMRKRKADSELPYIEKIDKQLDKLTKLIEDLLNISRMKVGKLRFEESTFSMAGLVKEIVEAVQPTLRKHTLNLDIQHDAYILGDRDRVGQIIINLITNAIKYSPQGDKVIIAITTTDNQQCLVSVQDFGIGIDKKHIAKIFNRFYQVHDKDGNAFIGLGIGLYLSQQIAQRHGGQIIVDSVKGQGSIFSLLLPIKK